MRKVKFVLFGWFIFEECFVPDQFLVGYFEGTDCQQQCSLRDELGCVQHLDQQIHCEK